MRCLALFTGGLDSQLAVCLLRQQGAEVVGLYVTTAIVDDSAAAQQAATRLNMELRTQSLDGYADLLRRPRLSHGPEVAPCLDCRAAMFALAKAEMHAAQADFVISGEVVGQRHATAIHELEVVAFHAGLADLLVRPLSAQLLPPTLPEHKGRIDRSRLLGLQGKGRREQERLAREFGIDPIPPRRPDCPLLAGPLTDRASDLLRSEQAWTDWDLQLLAIGRHFRLNNRAKVVLGRNRTENERLGTLYAGGPPGRVALAQPADFVGPTALFTGQPDDEGLRAVAGLIARFGRTEPGKMYEVQFDSAAGGLVLSTSSNAKIDSLTSIGGW